MVGIFVEANKLDQTSFTAIYGRIEFGIAYREQEGTMARLSVGPNVATGSKRRLKANRPSPFAQRSRRLGQVSKCLDPR
jgi:hypothetical protein